MLNPQRCLQFFHLSQEFENNLSSFRDFFNLVSLGVKHEHIICVISVVATHDEYLSSIERADDREVSWCEVLGEGGSGDELPFLQFLLAF